MSRADRHGGDVYAVAKEVGRPLTRILDFSASINPLGPAPGVRRAVIDALPQAALYPDPNWSALRLALSRRYALSPQFFLVGNGSTELIHVLPRALGLRHAIIIGPTFSEYDRSMRLAGGSVRRVLASRRSAYQPPLRQAAAAAKTANPRIDAVFLCNPNSPTGQGVQREDLLEVYRLVSREGAWCIVDETFIEYAGDHSVLADITRRARLVVLRSFTKFFALPGFRLGYLVAQPPVIDRIKKVMPPWSVSSLAQVAGLAALRDSRHMRRSLTFMAEERQRLAKRVSMIDGIVVFPSQANFLLVELPRGYSARVLTKTLRARGLLIRDCSAVPGLSERTIRIAVRRPHENDRLLAALRKVIC